MGLDAFKRIYWWEWTHRLIGRLIGLAFLLPFAWFALTGAIRGRLLARCAGLFLLGGLQGAVGWWMVASGLSARTSVSQYRLAVHLTLACLILAAVVAIARSLRHTPEAPPTPARLRATAAVLVALVLAQVFAGGLVAGLDAGLAFNTWPLMDGHLIPPLDQLAAARPWWRNLFENALTVQFDHRMIAYLLWGGEPAARLGRPPGGPGGDDRRGGAARPGDGPGPIGHRHPAGARAPAPGPRPSARRHAGADRRHCPCGGPHPDTGEHRGEVALSAAGRPPPAPSSH